MTRDEIAKVIEDEVIRQYEAHEEWELAGDMLENLDCNVIADAVVGAHPPDARDEPDGDEYVSPQPERTIIGRITVLPEPEAGRKPPKIVTDFVYPPIPIRTMDWQATYDDDEPDDEGRMACGRGATEAEAIRDLIADYPRSGNPCTACGKPFFDGDTCSLGGCPCGGDF